MQDNIPPTSEQVKKDPNIDELLQQLKDVKLNTVSKEDYDAMVANNSKLIKQIATERPLANAPVKVDTKDDIIARCKARTARLSQGTSLESIKGLVDNFKDMKALGMETTGVDEDVVTTLDALILESKGNPEYFQSLMTSRIKQK